MPEPQKPDGWESLRRHDDPDGPPEVGHDKRRHRNYTVRKDGSLAYDDVAETSQVRGGEVIQQEDAEPEQVRHLPAEEVPAVFTGRES